MGTDGLTPENAQSNSERRVATIESSLTGPHLDTFVQSILNILETSIAKETYSQIIDGLPLASVTEDSPNGRLPYHHPLHSEHAQLCPGVDEKAQEFRSNFHPSSLQLDAKLISDFRAASPGSRAFNSRLIEMAAEAVHELAVLLFNAGTSLHADGRIASWVPPKEHVFWEKHPDGAWPTLFYHHWYINHEKYPNGVADMVGFWAEARILGGVVLFDHRDADRVPGADADSIWFHSNRSDVTYRIYQLLDEQKHKLLEFLTSDTPDLKLLPIFGDERNANREDPEEPVKQTGIYRRLTDRKPLHQDAFDGRLRDVWTTFDYPTQVDFTRAQERAYSRQEQLYNNYDPANS